MGTKAFHGSVARPGKERMSPHVGDYVAYFGGMAAGALAVGFYATHNPDLFLTATGPNYNPWVGVGGFAVGFAGIAVPPIFTLADGATNEIHNIPSPKHHSAMRRGLYGLGGFLGVTGFALVGANL